MARTEDSILVIGAGLGGMATAIRLAAAGHAVQLFEAADAPGGKMRQLPSLAGPVDAGPTVLTMKPVFDALFAEAGARLEDRVDLVPLPELARHFWADGSQLDLYPDADASTEAIADFAGRREADAFAAFNKRASRLFEAFDAPMMQAAEPSMAKLMRTVLAEPRLLADMAPGRSLAGILKGAFRDPRLRQLFGRYATYVGGHPGQTPALLSLIWRAEAKGVWAVKGGMHGLAVAMASLARDLGVVIRYRAPVGRIEMQGGKVAGLQLETGERVSGRAVVFNGDPRALRQGLLGGGVTHAVPEAGVDKRSLSARVWTFAATPTGPDLAYHNVFFGADPATEFGPIARGAMPNDPTHYICAQDRIGPVDGLERFQIIINAAPQEHDKPEELERCRTQTFQSLERFGLRFSPEPDKDTVTGPGGFHKLFPASTGSLYGLSPHGAMAAMKRPRARTTIPGLYLAGGGAHPGAGIAMVTLSGAHAAAVMSADLALPSKSRPTAMRGGMSTASPTVAHTPSR
ncbi:MAG: 1-hydroxycarotenoid 3,4-desaturase CrtD [Pseudomonadota bacterium]